MPREPQIRTIDGHVVQVQALPVFAGHRLFMRLLKLVGGSFGPALAALASSGSKGIGDVDLTQHLGSLFATLSVEETESITRDLLAGAILDPHGKCRPLLDVANIEFQGAVLTLLKCAAFAIEVNFGDFRGLVLGMLTDARKKAESKVSPLPGLSGLPTSGQSGG